MSRNGEIIRGEDYEFERFSGIYVRGFGMDAFLKEAGSYLLELKVLGSDHRGGDLGSCFVLYKWRMH